MKNGTENKIRLHVYGDSILRGIMPDPVSGKYISINGSDFDPFREREVEVVNRSKFGCTVVHGSALISRALRGSTADRSTTDHGTAVCGWEKPCELMIVEYGGNDCDFDWGAVSDSPCEEHLPKTPLPVFREQLKNLVLTLRNAGIRPVLTSLPPIDAHRYLDHIAATVPGADRERILSWLGDEQLIYRYQEMYSSAVTQTAYETGTDHVDLRSAFLDKHNYRALLSSDGIHPNEAGHMLIRNAFSEAAERLLAPFAS